MEPQATATSPAPAAPVVPEFTGAPGNLANDLAALQAELAPAPVVPESVPVQAEVQTQPETTDKAPATVPEKFKAPDGSLDQAKLEKSTIHVEEALAKFAAKERELRQKQNEAHRQTQSMAPGAVPVAPAANQVPLTAFEIQVANDLINEAALAGYQMPQGQAIAQARVLVKMTEAKAAHEANLTEGLRVKLEDQDRRRELEAIAKYDDRVLSPEGFEALSRIRESKPWINQSQTPWTEAYQYFLAQQTQEARLKGTVLPTPTGLTAKAPPTPVGPAPRVSVQAVGPDINSMSEAEINAHVAKMTPAQEKAFWASRGLKFR